MAGCKCGYEQTIVLNGRVFDVKHIERPGFAWASYALHGARGARYHAVRNVARPDLLFVVNAKRGRADPFPGLWLTDKSGKLRVY